MMCFDTPVTLHILAVASFQTRISDTTAAQTHLCYLLLMLATPAPETVARTTLLPDNSANTMASTLLLL